MDPIDSSHPLGALHDHAEFLRRFARGLMGDEQGAEDLVQDTWVRALERPPRDGRAPRSWLATVARRLASNARRGERRRREREAAAAREESHEGETLERLELPGTVHREVLHLREPYRGVVYQRYYEGLSPRAIAKRRGVPLETVRSQLARARAILRARLDERAGGRRTWTAGLIAFALPPSALAGLASAPLAWIGGTLAMKKLLVAVVVLALSWWGWRELRGADPLPGAPSAVSPSAPAATGAPADPAPAAAAPAAASDAREALASVEIAAPPPSTGTLVARLRWERDGSPAAGIGLDALVLGDPAPREERLHADSDAGGEVRFEALVPGEVVLVSDRGTKDRAHVLAGQTREVEIALPAGMDVEGRVVDPEGNGVAGAGIWMESRGEVWSRHELARSRADGTFRVRGLGEAARVGARAAGFRPTLCFEVSALPPGRSGAREVTLVLGPPCGSVRGRVLRPDGEPVAGALVKIGAPGGGIVDLPSGLRGAPSHPVPIETDARGEFVYPGDLPEGAQAAHVQARGHPTWSGEVVVRCGETARLEIRLAEPARIAGRVLRSDGAPAAGMRVRAWPAGRGRAREAFPAPTAHTDGEGRFLLDWIPPGPQELEAADWKRARLGKARATVAVPAGGTVEAELVLDPGLTIGGRVVDGEGRPLVGWSVHAEPVRFGSALQGYDRTDAEGRFLIVDLAPGPWRISAAAPGEPAIPPRAEATAQPGAEDLELVVDSPGERARLRGRLLDADGSVPVHLELTIHAEGDGRGLFIDVDPDTGAFEHAATRAGRYVLRVIGGGRTLGMYGPYELHAGAPRDVGILRLEPPGVVELALEDVPAQDLPKLAPLLDRTMSGTEEMGLEGTVFRSRQIAAGTWTLRLENGPWHVGRREVEVRAGETTRVRLRAQPAHEVDLSAAFADPGAAWAELRAEIRDERGELVRSTPTWWPAAMRDGRVHYPGLTLPAGRFQVEAWTDTGLRGSVWIEVGEAPAHPHTLVLR